MKYQLLAWLTLLLLKRKTLYKKKKLYIYIFILSKFPQNLLLFALYYVLAMQRIYNTEANSFSLLPILPFEEVGGRWKTSDPLPWFFPISSISSPNLNFFRPNFSFPTIFPRLIFLFIDRSNSSSEIHNRYP